MGIVGKAGFKRSNWDFKLASRPPSLSLSLPYSGPAPPCSSKDSFYDTSSGLRVGEERFLKGKSNFLPKRRGGGGLGPRQLSATGHTGQAQRPAQELRAHMDVESLVCLSTHAEP